MIRWVRQGFAHLKCATECSITYILEISKEGKLLCPEIARSIALETKTIKRQ